jgi:excisionase family DNA binding protein
MTDATPKPTGGLLTIDQVADLCGSSLRTVHKWLKTNAIPAPIRLGAGPRGAIRFRQTEIETWIQNGCPRCEEQSAPEARQ